MNDAKRDQGEALLYEIRQTGRLSLKALAILDELGIEPEIFAQTPDGGPAGTIYVLVRKEQAAAA